MMDTPEISKETIPADMIGDRFIKAGFLNEQQVLQVIKLQETSHLRFGEAAIQLGLLNEQQVQLALSRQFNYATALDLTDHLDQSLVIAHAPFSLEAENIRHLRTELTLRLQGGGPYALSIVSPDKGAGKSYLAANLAIAFSQMGKRTLLIDADMRSPTQDKLFNLSNKTGLSLILSNRAPLFPGIPVASFPHLQVLTAGPIPPNPQEILLDSALKNVVAQLSNDFDIFIVDTPPSNDSSNAQSITKQLGMCLLVARQHKTQIRTLRQLHTDMTITGAQILGTVYNGYRDRTSDLVTKNNKIWARLRQWLRKKH